MPGRTTNEGCVLSQIYRCRLSVALGKTPLGDGEALVAATQQIADWLKKLGMSEYAQRFAENDIDPSVLPELTDQDWKDLGVSLGHRRKMLRAIRDLGGAPVAATDHPHLLRPGQLGETMPSGDS
jgi:hypothetical protein